MEQNTLAFLPPSVEIETKKVLKRVNKSNQKLALLNGFSRTIRDQYVLIRALSLQETKDCLEIKSITTMTDKLYQAELFKSKITSSQAKDVRNYVVAFSHGYEKIGTSERLTINNICSIQHILKKMHRGNNVYFFNKELFLILSTISNVSDNKTMEIVTDNGSLSRINLSQCNDFTKKRYINRGE